MRFLGILIGTVFLLTACSASGPEEMTVTKIIFGTALNEREEVTKEVESFVPDNTFHAQVVAEGVSEQQEVTGAWWYTDKNLKIFETQVVVTPERPVAKFVLMNQKPWPVGTYRFVVTRNGATLAEKDIVVIAPTEPAP